MNASRWWAVATVGLLVIPSVGFARSAARDRRAAPLRAATIDRAVYVDANRVNMLVSNIGSFAFDGTNAALEFPKGSGKTAVFAGGLWLGGKINGVTKVAITAYSNEWFPGNILPGGVPANPTDPIFKVYNLNRVYTDDAERDAALADYNAGALPYGADTVIVDPDNGTLNILGDQMTWTVYNEADSTLKATSEEDAGHTGPMGVEVQQTIFAFNRTGALGQTIFLRFRMFNKGVNQIDSMFVSVWSDPDLGEFTDDLVGCDVPLSVGYVYNSTNDDAIYGTTPPCVGYDFFKGPTGYLGTELGLSSFNKYSNEAGGDPDQFVQVYNFMRGLNRDGTPVINPVTNQVTTYVVSGDPVAASGWLDSSPADRRLMLSSGPFQMAPGDTQEVVVGLVIGDAPGDNTRLPSISLMKFYDSFAQSAFDQNFDLAPPPNPVVVNATVSEKSAILTWDNSTENYNEPPYDWEGYVVYQGASRSGPWKRLATFDHINGIGTVLDPDFDAESGQILPTVKALGTDRGVAYTYVATQDAVRGGPLRVGTPYYFAVTNYAVGVGQTPQVLESAITFDLDPTRTTVYTLIPQTPVAGVNLGSATLSAVVQDQEVPGAAVPGTDDVTVSVVDPMRLVTASYKLGYKPDATGTLGWYVVRTMGAASDTIANNQSNFSGDNVYPVFDGLQLKISGAPLGQLLRVTYGDVGPNPPTYIGFGDNLGFPYFNGSADYCANMGATLAGLGSKLDPTDVSQFTTVEMRLTDGSPGQKAYLYRQSATAPRTYPYTAYVDVPFTVWDVVGNRQLNCGLFEFDAASPNSAWDPEQDPTDPFGRREWLYIFQSDYSGTTPDPFYTTTYPNARTNAADLDFMYVLWCAQALDGGGAPIPSDVGDKVSFILSSRSTNDNFTFSTTAANRTDVASAQSELAKIRAVPNPYFAHSTYEFNQFNRSVKFTHLPERCTIRIFTLAGELIRTLEKNDPSTSQLSWDIETASSLPVSSGVYIFHVDAPGFGTHVGKVVVFMEKERLNTF